MIRRFNYTQRKRINRSSVTVALNSNPSGIHSFDVRMDLADLDLPGDAQVFIEAYYRSAYMRFSFGTVDCIQPPDKRELSEIEPVEVVFFRIKVVDRSKKYGQLLADAEGITPQESTLSTRRCLLHVVFRDLGNEIWKLEFEDAMPVLVVNSLIDGISDIVLKDKAFFSLVYPAVVREILHRILIVDKHDPSDDEEEWPDLWLKFVSQVYPVSVPDADDDAPEASESDRLEWIERAVAAFCVKHTIKDVYDQSRIREGS